MAKAHPGFKAVQAKIAKREGIPSDRAGAILASAARKASPKAKRANPRLKKVQMPMHPGDSDHLPAMHTSKHH